MLLGGEKYSFCADVSLFEAGRLAWDTGWFSPLWALL